MRKMQDRCTWRGLWYLPLWYVVLGTVALAACRKETLSYAHLPSVNSPAEGAIYCEGESLRISADVEAGVDFQTLEVFLDDALIFSIHQRDIDTLLSGLRLEEGTHVVRAVCCDMNNQCLEDVVSFQLVSFQGEARQEESFSGAPLSGWHLSNWEQSGSAGVDDGYSLRSVLDPSVAITRRHFDQPGNIRFYVKGGSGGLEFMVDGKTRSLWFGKEDWGVYSYYVPAGNHIFKWISHSENVCLDKITFTPGLVRHSAGEIYGGGIIISVDSTEQHGLIAAREDGRYQGNPEIPWGCYGLVITTGNRAQSKSDGDGNTRAIVSDCDWEKIAARYCYDLSVSEDGRTWDDWYLPALDELIILYKNRDKLEGLEGDYYWSSTSYSTQGASVINFNDGKHHGAHRNIPNIPGLPTVGIHVRPVRSF